MTNCKSSQVQGFKTDTFVLKYAQRPLVLCSDSQQCPRQLRRSNRPPEGEGALRRAGRSQTQCQQSVRGQVCLREASSTRRRPPRAGSAPNAGGPSRDLRARSVGDTSHTQHSRRCGVHGDPKGTALPKGRYQHTAPATRPHRNTGQDVQVVEILQKPRNLVF